MQDLTHVQFAGIPVRRGARPGGPRSPAPLPAIADASPSLPSAFPAFVLTRGNLDPGDYRRASLERRLGACLRALKAQSIPDAYARLREAPGLLPHAVSALLIGVSSFFRDAGAFETLRSLVLPALAERPAPLRVWSVGCSTGEELYSIAILFADAGLLDRVTLLGIDCREDALAVARGGAYADDVLKGLDETIRARHFRRTGSGWQVAEGLRARTEWRCGDATRELPEGRADLVLCRNLLIYLQPPAVERLLGGLRDRLTAGGFLVLGEAERPGGALGFEPVGRSVYRRPRG
jgi:chemotaxis methyl-accepting protein methylase